MYNPYQPLTARTRHALGVLSLLGVLGAWALVSGLELVGPAKLPSPSATLQAFLFLAWDAQAGESRLLTATLWSGGRVALALAFVVALGVPLGLLMGASPRINALLSPLVDPFRSAPVVALLPILVMWLGIGETMKVAFLFLGAVVFLVPMVRDAVVAVPREYWVDARDLGATPAEAVFHAVIPLAKPRIFDAIITALSVMWTYITVAEYVNAGAGLGQLIQNARRFSAMDQVFAGIFVIIALALGTYQFMLWLKRLWFPWEVER
jgi:ABC-type nitrate/sulfonate/bicarbonate transport system permease component